MGNDRSPGTHVETRWVDRLYLQATNHILCKAFDVPRAPRKEATNVCMRRLVAGFRRKHRSPKSVPVVVSAIRGSNISKMMSILDGQTRGCNQAPWP